MTDQPEEDEPFTLQNDKPKKQPEKFEQVKRRQLPLLSGLDCAPGQQDLFDDLVAN